MFFLWLCNDECNCLDDNVVNYNINDGLSNNNISGIIEDKKGNIWFGSYGGGISLFYGNYFKTFKESIIINNKNLLI